MNIWQCLPQQVAFLQSYPNLRELRIRNGCAIRANVGGNWLWVGQNKLLSQLQGATVFGEVCNQVVSAACNNSIYAYEKMLAEGYFTLQDGCRIGVCGQMGATAFRRYTSLCVRFARYVSCACPMTQSFVVVGPPGSGKTTFLRDFACKTSLCQNVVVADERGEISCCKGFEQGCCDVLLFAEKAYAFEVATRSMSPQWLVCDELLQSQLPLLQIAAASGVKVAASMHAGNKQQLLCRLAGSAFFQKAVLLQQDFSYKIEDLAL